MRPFGPLPLTSASGTPSSRASFRIVGEACGKAPCGAVGSCAGSAAVGIVRSECPGAAAGAGAAAAPAAAAARRRRGSARRAAGALQRRDRGALGHLVADLDLERLYHAGMRRGDLHRRLVALDRDQALLGGDAVAGLDQHLDDRDLVEVADVGDDDLDRAHPHPGPLPPGRGEGGAEGAGAWPPLPRQRERAGVRVQARRGLPPALALQHQHRRSFADLVAELDAHLLHHAGGARRNLHRRLVALDRHQRLLGLDPVARLDQHLDDLDVLEIADVRHLHFHGGHRAVLQASSGLILSASIPYLAIASATFVAGTLPSSASAFSAATTT